MTEIRMAHRLLSATTSIPKCITRGPVALPGYDRASEHLSPAPHHLVPRGRLRHAAAVGPAAHTGARGPRGVPDELRRDRRGRAAPGGRPVTGRLRVRLRLRHVHWFRRVGDDAFSGAALYACRCGEVRPAP